MLLKVNSWLIYLHYHLLLRGGAVVVVITWQLDLQIPIHSVTITTSVESSNLAHCEVYSILCQWFASGQWFSPGTPFFSTSKADRHNIAEIFLKVTLNTITANPLLRGELAIRHYCGMSGIAIAGIIQYRLYAQRFQSMYVLVPTVCTLCFVFMYLTYNEAPDI